MATQTLDRSLAEKASAEERILLTDDKDFGEIVFREGRATSGVVLMRIPPSRWRAMWPALKTAIAEYGVGLRSRFTVLEEARIRSVLLKDA